MKAIVISEPGGPEVLMKSGLAAGKMVVTVC
jgi:hypothetical protein